MYEEIEILDAQIKESTDNKERAELMVRKGVRLFELSRYADALDVLENAIVCAPESSIDNQAHLRAAMTAYYAGKYSLSTSHFQHEFPPNLNADDLLQATIFKGDALARNHQYQASLDAYALASALLFKMPNSQDRVDVAKKIQERASHVIKQHRKTKGQE